MLCIIVLTVLRWTNLENLVVYNIVSLKARNTLRNIDIISMKEWKEERLGLFTFDLSFTN
jgi:hypothetical protein